ncbi:MAG: sigma 54-interacting transcriptional regulator [Desulfobacterales bacterium]|nr:sigma 54-interacting transcriptional regulator [Desulfobacterales bacterium]
MPASTLKLELLFWDRKQIVEDIAKCIGLNDLNIISMEVKNQNGRTLVYIETQSGSNSPENKDIMESLEAIPDLIRITRITAMPSEIRKKRLELVLDSIRDGIIAIEKDRSVTFINPVAKKMYGWDSPDFTGKKITELPLENLDLMDCLKGKSFYKIKRNVITRTGRFQFFSNCIPITDSTGEVTGAIEVMRDMRQIKELADEVTSPSRFTFSDIIGTSEPIMDAISFAQKIAKSASVVSIRGESGTGKELFARAIHTESRRPGKFVAVNCAALPESLLESELFGYEKGTFTGAEKKGKQGLFEIADKGTLFLDEIADMPPGAQAKILRVIQEKSVRRIGGAAEIPVDTRIITATSRLIEEMIKDNLFREDLYYRINVLPIHVPPLKGRIGDITPLTDHFLARIAKQVGSIRKKLTPDALEKLRHHTWPGNVRELKNVIERGSIMSDKDTIDSRAIIFGHEIEERIRELKSPFQATEGKGTLKEQVGRFEKELIESALKRYPSIRKCAVALKISHTAMINKMKKYQITR